MRPSIRPNITTTALLIALPTAVYTMFGGVQAVTWTDVKTMSLTIVALVVAMVFLVRGLPEGVGVDDALAIAGGTGRLQAFDFRFTLTETYTFWSGMLGGLFLMLSYFGCDQSQVQRYLTAKSEDAGKTSLLMSAYTEVGGTPLLVPKIWASAAAAPGAGLPVASVAAIDMQQRFSFTL